MNARSVAAKAGRAAGAVEGGNAPAGSAGAQHRPQFIADPGRVVDQLQPLTGRRGLRAELAQRRHRRRPPGQNRKLVDIRGMDLVAYQLPDQVGRLAGLDHAGQEHGVRIENHPSGRIVRDDAADPHRDLGQELGRAEPSPAELAHRIASDRSARINPYHAGPMPSLIA
jgi:hypothetical protein